MSFSIFSAVAVVKMCLTGKADGTNFPNHGQIAGSKTKMERLMEGLDDFENPTQGCKELFSASKCLNTNVCCLSLERSPDFLIDLN